MHIDVGGQSYNYFVTLLHTGNSLLFLVTSNEYVKSAGTVKISYADFHYLVTFLAKNMWLSMIKFL
jgi:hypothetical protein